MPLFQRAPDADTMTLVCPHDAHELREFEVEGVRIDRCDGCGGTWFDEHELRRVAKDRELEKLATRLPLVKGVSPFRCPRCAGECVEGHVAEVNVDTCTACHGVWLDRGELTEAKRQLDTRRLLAGHSDGFRAFLGRL